MVAQQLVAALVFSWEEMGLSTSTPLSCLWPLFIFLSGCSRTYMFLTYQNLFLNYTLHMLYGLYNNILPFFPSFVHMFYFYILSKFHNILWLKNVVFFSVLNLYIYIWTVFMLLIVHCAICFYNYSFSSHCYILLYYFIFSIIDRYVVYFKFYAITIVLWWTFL